MKTVKFFASAILSSMLFTSALLASGGESGSSAKASENALRDQIVDVLSNVSSGTSGVVYVLFSVDKEKGLEVLNVSGVDGELANKVKSKLANNKFSIPSSLEGKYMIKVRFADSYEVADKNAGINYLRSQISDKLTSLNASEGTSVNLVFSVNNSELKLKDVTSEDLKLATAVKSALSSSSFDLPSGIAGTYELKVKF